MIAAIVFDFDGVLADSEPLHLSAFQEVLASLGAALPREEYYADYLGFDDAGVFRAVAEARGLTVSTAGIQALVAEKARTMESLMGHVDVLYPGARDCVRRLASTWPLGIASGALRHEIEAVLAQHDLSALFRFIVAAGETAASKPAPDPYRRAAALHGVDPSECLAIEDSRWGIESAKAAGLSCVAVTHTYSVSELLDADAIVGSLAELTPDLVRSL
ncbi:MAG TPA: HAD family phosphatase [Vicinamibacterales bacterium]|nr:HAD family phosphatase [Vicinamibacterales bacterium]